MSVVHIRPLGTKTATGSGDYASTADNWDLSNCYKDLAMVGWNATAGSPADYILDGDEVIFYSDIAAPVTHATLSFPPVRNIEPGGTVTFKSKDGDVDGCILASPSATGTGLLLDPLVTKTNYTFEDIIFTRTPTLTTVNIDGILIRNEVGNVTWSRCKFKDYTTAMASANNPTHSNIIHSSLDGTATNRIVRFTDCEFSGLTLNYHTSGGIILLEATGGDTQTLLFDGTNTFDDIILNATDPTAASLSGAIKPSANVTLTINGIFNVTNYTSNVASANANTPFIKANGPMNGNGVLTGTNMTVEGGTTTGCFIHCINTFDLNEINTVDCNTIWREATNGTSSCTFLAQTSAAIGTISKIKAVRPRSKFGPACYWSGGGTLTLDQLIVEDAKVLHGVIYGGGDGDVTIKSALITGSRQDATLLTAGDTLPDFPGTDVYIQVHTTTAVKDKVSKLSQFTILDTDTAAVWSVDIRNTNGTWDHDATLNNFVFDSGHAIELHTQEGATSVMNCTLNNCAIPTAEIDDNIGVGAGTFTNNDPITTDPHPNADGSIPVDNILGVSGLRHWGNGANPVDINGELFTDLYTAVGSQQPTWHPFHPVNL